MPDLLGRNGRTEPEAGTGELIAPRRGEHDEGDKMRDLKTASTWVAGIRIPVSIEAALSNRDERVTQLVAIYCDELEKEVSAEEMKVLVEETIDAVSGLDIASVWAPKCETLDELQNLLVDKLVTGAERRGWL